MQNDFKSALAKKCNYRKFTERKNCFQQAIYALNLIDISFYGEERGSEIGSENEARSEGKSFLVKMENKKKLNNLK